MRAVMAFSGGMDSTGLLMRLLDDGYKVDCISYQYGQKHNIEVERAKENIEYLSHNGHKVTHRIVDLSSAMGIFQSALLKGGDDIPEGHYEQDQMKATVVPNRNAIFASIIYGYALSIALRENRDVVIALGVHSGDHAIYPDCRPEFYNALQHAFTIGNWDSEKISFHLPYLDGDKETILRDSWLAVQSLGLDFDVVFANTNTSYNPDEFGRASGTSGADVERILAFHAFGREDPVQYVKPWREVLAYALKAEENQRDEEYQNRLTEEQYQVTRGSATEAAFTGIYWDEKRSGNYFCICCNTLLFTSKMKYDSGCGWPSFHTEHSGAEILRISDESYGMARVEVKCKNCDAHLGHIFEDGPAKYGGERYCINSASLEFEEE